LFSRRTILAGAGVLAAWPAAAAPPVVTVQRSPTCGCCGGWATLMKRAGFQLRIVEVEDVVAAQAKAGVPEALASCHVSSVAGYTLVGHVPPEDVRSLLVERPKARGLAVPGMPAGSPGMERSDGRRSPYDTLLLLADGRTRIYRRHG